MERESMGSMHNHWRVCQSGSQPAYKTGLGCVRMHDSIRFLPQELLQPE
jgi:hypothetical protein